MSVAAFVAGIDRLLSRGHELFPAGGGVAGGQVFAAGGGPIPVPGVPAGGDSGLTGGVAAAGGAYQRAHVVAAGFDTDAGEAVDQSGAVGVQGRAGSGVIRDQARAVGAVTPALGGSPAGVQLILATMDQHLAAMQRQLDQTTAQNRLLALRLRQLAAGYRGMGSPGRGAAPLSGLSGLMGGGGLSGLRGLSGLAALPASLVGHRGGGGRSGQWSAGARGGRGALGAAGVARGALSLSEVSFEGKGVWAGGRAAMRRYLEEALDHLGITDPRGRANWMEGMTTIADHESGYRANAINVSDSNAHGARQADGGPLHATRGPWQVMPDTFARYHQWGTSNHIWDPVASACASMNYQMARYGVSRDGHDQRAKVGQANWNVHHGY